MEVFIGDVAAVWDCEYRCHCNIAPWDLLHFTSILTSSYKLSGKSLFYKGAKNIFQVMLVLTGKIILLSWLEKSFWKICLYYFPQCNVGFEVTIQWTIETLLPHQNKHLARSKNCSVLYSGDLISQLFPAPNVISWRAVSEANEIVIIPNYFFIQFKYVSQLTAINTLLHTQWNA